jgi:ribosomal protein L29
MLAESRGKLRSLRFEIAQGKVKNHHALLETRRDIAKIMTIVEEESLKNKEK